MSTPLDVSAIRSRLASAYLLDRNDGDALMRAMGDVRQLLHEVEGLRAEAYLHQQGAGQLRAERDHFREAWAAAQVRLDCGTDATEAVRKERAAVVAWLRAHGTWCAVCEASAGEYADCIERGEHRREEER